MPDDAAHNITAEFSEMELQLGLRAPGDDLLTELKSFKDEIRTLSSEMREFRLEMADFRVSLAGVNARIDGVERRLEAIEQGRAEPPPEIADLQTKVTLLQQELNDRDQEALLSDLEIGHLPEEKGESVLHAVTVLASKLGVTLEPRDVVFAERVGVAQGATAASQAPRERRVVVRLARRDLRDQMLQGRGCGVRCRPRTPATPAARADASSSTRD